MLNSSCKCNFLVKQYCINMIKKLYLLALLFLVVIISCTKKTTKTTKLSDNEFIEFISDTNFRKTIFKIDSLTSVNNFSTHQTGLLYYEKGRVLGHLEKDIEAIVSLENALSFFNKENDQKFIAKTNMLLSVSNGFLSKKRKALGQVTTALKIYREINDKKGEAKALNSLAHIEFQYGNFEKSIEFVKQASVIQLNLKDNDALAASYNNIGYVLEQAKLIDSASTYYKKAILLNKKNNRLNSDPQRNLGYIYASNKENEKSKLLYLEALKIEEQAGRLSLQKEIYDALLDISIKDKSFENSLLYVAKRDSISELFTKLENEEKIKLIENQYKLVSNQKELQQQKNNNDKNKIIFAILTGLLFFLGLFFLQRNKNSKLKLEREKLRLEQKMLRTQMNPHFVFNALTAIQNTLLDDDPLKSSTYLSRFAKLVRQNFEFVNKKFISLEEDLDALKNYIETQQLRFENKFDYKITVQDTVDTSFIQIPPMLLQPFIENAIEHGLKPKKAKGLLQIYISEKGEFTRFKILDDGVGYTKNTNFEDREHAIDVFIKRLKLRGFGEEKLFSIQPLENKLGTQVIILLKLI